MGDPAGIGPEIIVKALQADILKNIHSVVIGSAAVSYTHLTLPTICSV